jgi:hypothetical protein
MQTSGKNRERILSAAIFVALLFLFGTPVHAADQTLFTSQAPTQVAQSDGASVNYELGTVFQSNVSGQINAIRFWKDVHETGTHTGRLWSASGQLLASVVFVTETASGWQQQALAVPLPIAANTAYVVSVNTGNTYYVTTVPGLASQVVSGNLSSVVGNNGVYGPVGTFPTNSWFTSNYFRDVDFAPVATSIAPTIATQPVSKTITAGQTATFSVAAISSSPMTYQWMKNGTAVTGATSISYTTPAETTSDNNAQFSVTVTNSAGSVTSATATLMVNPGSSGCMTTSGAWANSALSQTATGSFSVAFDATPTASPMDGVMGLSFGPASGYANLAAIVRFNNAGYIDAMNKNAYSAVAKIPFQAGITYHFILDVNAVAHTYSAYVMVGSVQTTIGSNFAFRSDQGNTSSLNNLGTVSIIGSDTVCNIAMPTGSVSPVAPAVTTQPSSKTITAGQTATFSVVAAGTAPMTFQWMKNTIAISGATSSSYTTPAETTADNNAQFSVTVTNGVGNATSNAAVLSVNAAAVAPTITTQPSSQTVNSGQMATFNVAATGTAPMTYQWKKNSTAITGATSSTYSTMTTTSDNGTQFSVVLSNAAGSAASNPATLTVNTVAVAPAITTQPVSKTITAGQTATFSVAASGTSPMTYQWTKNSIVISGATSSSYTTPAETTADTNAQFSVTVTNSVGSATSNPATLTVSAATLILNSSATALSFGNVNLSSSTTKNVTLTNAGTSSVTISSVSVNGAGFTANGVPTGLILNPGQTATLAVTFSPSSAVSLTGNASVASNATNSPDAIALTGTGVAVVNHSATLTWSPSTSTVTGYNTYSGTKSGGPYTKLTSAPNATTSYTDSTVQSGLTYYYVVTAVDSSGMESAYSTETSAIIP